MRIASYLDGGVADYGVVINDGGADVIVPASATLRDSFPTVRALLEGDAVDALRRDVEARHGAFPVHSVDLTPPIVNPRNTICVGINYPKIHPTEGVVPPPKHIIIFGKFEGALVGHDAPLIQPRHPASQTFDYEGELALVVGKPGRHIDEADAFDHIAGYTIVNDGSVREWQKHSLQAGKNFAASGACGPWIVTADEITDASALALQTRLNGEVVQSTTVAEMIFSIPVLIAYISSVMDLCPGDIISTGSPEGAGASRTPQRFLQVGDELEIEWSRIGILRNHVAAAS